MRMHKEWLVNPYMDVCYCKACNAAITKQELFAVWCEEELYQDCLDRIARQKGMECNG